LHLTISPHQFSAVLMQAHGDDVLGREVEAHAQTGQKERGGDQSFGLSEGDQKAAKDRGYDKPQMSRSQSESEGRTSGVRSSMKKSTEEVEKQGGGDQTMRELQPQGSGTRPEHKE
jgi:hypothetical protein